MPAKSTKNFPEVRKCELPSSMLIGKMVLFGNAEMPIFSTDAGMQIDLRDVHFENARDSICVRFEPASNDIVERETQPEKQCLHKISTEAGIQIDTNDEHP
jgi:hypothetical protein